MLFGVQGRESSSASQIGNKLLDTKIAIAVIMAAVERMAVASTMTTKVEISG